VTVVEQPTHHHKERSRDWSPSELRRVVLRLRDGDVVQVGTAPNRDSALVLAHSVISEIDEPSGEWPRVGDRLVCPEAVVSVDVLETG
jgi:hypothetical protein